MHITGEVGRVGSVRHLCMRCADLEEPAAVNNAGRLNGGAVLFAMGLFTIALCLLADRLHLGRSEGLGWKQCLGLAVGAVLMGTGALMRILTVFVIGSAFTLLTILADWLRLGGQEGFGWKQTGGAVVGLGLVLVGLVLAHRRRAASAGVPGERLAPCSHADVLLPGLTSPVPAQAAECVSGREAAKP